MDKIYIFSGLGVDKRVFDNINFNNLNIEFIDWIEPIKGEPLLDYVKRISEKISVENSILIGLSFGGIVSVEIAKILKVKKIILIASAKNKYELPKIYRFAGKFKLSHYLPTKVLKKSNFITDWMFGVNSKDEKILLKQILEDTDPNFLLWAINEIANWKNLDNPKKYIHIHGNNDRIIPVKNVKATHIIEGGGHFMTVSKPHIIEEIIKNNCF